MKEAVTGMTGKRIFTGYKSIDGYKSCIMVNLFRCFSTFAISQKPRTIPGFGHPSLKVLNNNRK
jgi:hypothetical protein